MGVWEKEVRRQQAMDREMRKSGRRHGDRTWFPRFRRHWRLVLCATGFTCLGCRRDDVPVTRDHIVPRHLMGKHDVHNLQPLCEECNRAKGARTVDLRPPEMIDENGRWRVVDLLGPLLEEVYEAENGEYARDPV